MQIDRGYSAESCVIRLGIFQPRSQGISRGREDERPWERGWVFLRVSFYLMKKTGP